MVQGNHDQSRTNPMQKILIMGLPGSGKTTLAKKLVEVLSEKDTVTWLNADEVRKYFNDWDFSYEGRIRQAYRMRQLAEDSNSKFVVADFVAPLKEMREAFDPDILVWVDTVVKGRFEDTNQIFQKPKRVDVHVLTKDSDRWVNEILLQLNNSFD